MQLWLPSTKAEAGADVYITRLKEGLKPLGYETIQSSFPHKLQYFPWLLKGVNPPSGTKVSLASTWAGFAFKRRNIPHVIVEHHCVFDPAYKPYRNFAQKVFHEYMLRQFEASSFKTADAIVTPSHYTANSLSQAFDINPDNITVIHNGVDTDFYTPEPSGKRTTEGRKIRLLYVGNLSRRKGIDLLPQIMQQLGQDYELYYTGGLRANKLFSYQKNIHSLGRLTNEELRDEYRKADILLFPSRFEGFGYAPVEAMACGTPVVTTNCSSLTEVVKDGVTGILCPIDNVEAFSNAIKNLTQVPNKLISMGEAGHAHVNEHFSILTMAKKYLHLFNKLINRPN
ncbi:MAG: glycosyltransferase family 4 protein [Methylobacter sp.]